MPTISPFGIDGNLELEELHSALSAWTATLPAEHATKHTSVASLFHCLPHLFSPFDINVKEET
jgi:hypothetical protein